MELDEIRRFQKRGKFGSDELLLGKIKITGGKSGGYKKKWRRWKAETRGKLWNPHIAEIEECKNA